MYIIILVGTSIVVVEQNALDVILNYSVIAEMQKSSVTYLCTPIIKHNDLHYDGILLEPINDFHFLLCM